jgi:predicted MFS family arabinose efflux permease
VIQPWHAWLLYGVVFAIGNGIASLVIVGVIVMRIYPGRAGLANAVAISGMSVGQLIMIAVLAGLLAQIGWRSVFVWVGLAHLALLPLLLALPRASSAPPPGTVSLSLGEAARTPRFWLLLAIYAICGLDDFFVTTHVAAFAQDRGLGILAAGNLLAFMGLTGQCGRRPRRLRHAFWCSAGSQSINRRSRLLSSRLCSARPFWSPRRSRWCLCARALEQEILARSPA